MKPALALCSALVLLLASALAPADDAVLEQRFKEHEGEFITGPSSIDIAGQATLDLQEGLMYIKRPVLEKIFAGSPQKWPEAMDGMLMEDQTGDKEVADSWGGAGIFYQAEGHIDDADAQKLDAGKLLANIKKNTEKSNEKRVQAGQPALEVLGWHAPPAYDVKTHQLQWSLLQREKGKPETERVIFNTISLGREGSLSFMVVISKDKLASHGHIAAGLLPLISFNAGRSYSDFDPAHDKKAKSTLTSLIEQADGMHLGLIALLLGFLAKFGKVIAIAIIGATTALGALRKKKAA